MRFSKKLKLKNTKKSTLVSPTPSIPLASYEKVKQDSYPHSFPLSHLFKVQTHQLISYQFG